MNKSILPTVTTIFEKVEPAARQGNLLLPLNTSVGHQTEPFTNGQRKHELPGSELIPHRERDLEAMREYSPFSRPAPMRSREAQRLYQAIDGRRSLAELAILTQLNTKDIEKALHQLVTQNLVQVCNKTDQPIEGPWFLE